jgi:hypothetical protein
VILANYLLWRPVIVVVSAEDIIPIFSSTHMMNIIDDHL